MKLRKCGYSPSRSGPSQNRATIDDANHVTRGRSDEEIPALRHEGVEYLDDSDEIATVDVR